MRIGQVLLQAPAELLCCVVKCHGASVSYGLGRDVTLAAVLHSPAATVLLSPACSACVACGCLCCIHQVDTRDVLFVVGGAFVHLEKLLMDSRHKSSIGFGNKVSH